MDNTNYMMSADQVAAELGVSRGHAYKLIRQMNEELTKEGYIIIAGKVPKRFLETKIFGFRHEIVSA